MAMRSIMKNRRQISPTTLKSTLDVLELRFMMIIFLSCLFMVIKSKEQVASFFDLRSQLLNLILKGAVENCGKKNNKYE